MSNHPSLEPMPSIEEVLDSCRDKINPKDVVLFYNNLVELFTKPLKKTFNKMSDQISVKRNKNRIVSDEFFKGQNSVILWAIQVIKKYEMEIKKSEVRTRGLR